MSAADPPLSSLQPTEGMEEDGGGFNLPMEGFLMVCAWITVFIFSLELAFLLRKFRDPESAQLQRKIKISSALCVLSWILLFTTHTARHTVTFVTNNDPKYEPPAVEKFYQASSVFFYFSAKILLYATFIQRLYLTFMGSIYSISNKVFVGYGFLLFWEGAIAVTQAMIWILEDKEYRLLAIISALCSITDLFVGPTVIYLFAKNLMKLLLLQDNSGRRISQTLTTMTKTASKQVLQELQGPGSVGGSSALVGGLESRQESQTEQTEQTEQNEPSQHAMQTVPEDNASNDKIETFMVQSKISKLNTTSLSNEENLDQSQHHSQHHSQHQSQQSPLSPLPQLYQLKQETATPSRGPVVAPADLGQPSSPGSLGSNVSHVSQGSQGMVVASAVLSMNRHIKASVKAKIKQMNIALSDSQANIIHTISKQTFLGLMVVIVGVIYGAIFISFTLWRSTASWFWFPPKVALYFTAYTDVICLFFCFAFNHNLYRTFCKSCHNLFQRMVASCAM